MIQLIKDFNEIIHEGGWLVVLIILAFLGNRKYWVFGWLYKEKVEGERYWREKYFNLLNVTRQTVEVTESMLPLPGRRKRSE